MKTMLIMMTLLVPIAGSAGTGDGFLYFSNEPGWCNIPDWQYEGSYSIFVHTGDLTGVTGGRFRLESDLYGPEDLVSFAPASGVTVVEGDPFTGMTLSWTPETLEHRELLTLTLADNLPHQTPEDPYSYCVWTRECVLFRAGAEDVALVDVCTAVAIVDCFDPIVQWIHPDTVDVVIDGTTVVEIRWIVGGGGFVGTYLDLSDTEGWTTSFVPHSVWGGYCPGCPWQWETTRITVDVPKGTEDHATSLLTIMPEDFPSPTSFWLRAVEEVGVEKTTFGGIKARYYRPD
jgi:hypothetical protein